MLLSFHRLSYMNDLHGFDTLSTAFVVISGFNTTLASMTQLTATRFAAASFLHYSLWVSSLMLWSYTCDLC